MQPLSSERFHPYARPQRSGGHASPIGPPSGRFSAPLAAAPLPVPPVPQTPRKTLSVAVADGLGVGTTTMELRELASSVATVSDVRLLGDGSSAEIGFTTSDGALMFKRRYNRHDVNGSRISVSVRT
ncbi:hypothetical protein HK105_202031 [Polyrhizophydium stewartii]|uniref:Phosphodiester glycosidase domain-containing protein n=1 Tax=Polyrhizophydium stewartii TaxID=2732419 RepID=A0ABR4NGP1_9FUNG